MFAKMNGTEATLYSYSGYMQTLFSAMARCKKSIPVPYISAHMGKPKSLNRISGRAV